MPIDDLSSERALERLRLEDLSRGPDLTRLLPTIVTKALLALLDGDLSQAADLFTQCQDSLESGRSNYLLACVVEDLKWLRGKLEKLTETQEKYLSTDWVALLVDADRKARATLGKTKIERIARVLCTSIRIEPTPPTERVEELMQVATELTDGDVLVLRHIRDAAERYERLPPDAVHNLRMPEVPGLLPESVLGICGKLQSLGLIATAQQHAITTNRFSYPGGGGFVLLSRAQEFLRFVVDTHPAP